MRAPDVLRTAEALITGDRAKTHGPALENHMNIAALWTAYLRGKLKEGEVIDPDEVAHLMALLKIARTKTGSPNDDDDVDAAAYIALRSQIIDELNAAR